ncbi:SDR family oxidoreductase [Microlunatus panaciterrae]|uniref:NAD(P)-dependent dehydrogenase (Short-subunit alcohol dehydrogenase family) n=1 Tax=Microlunatus panaciterrae TaxID=400768 RepID=A0ABS2RKK6_9ACTN|nr:SDR family oxidoreductase [Microlunatus panaciterrae]MBM7799536.1 NAD(P)-dependent dehydrogenase (short-subunit alcohol dehydrogenase family) [Microlunatus panaciterrae]
MALSKVALITGGSRGIGAATARALAAEGWDIAISYRARQDAAEQVAEECRALGRRALTVRADVSDQDDIAALFAAAATGLGEIDAVVNNAGVVPPASRVEHYDADRVNQLFATNVTGAFLVAAHAVRRMSSMHGGRGGVIVNVSSRAAVLGGAGEYVDYAASKAAIDALTIGLAAEVGAEGIRVVGVRPGLIDTEIHAPGRLERLGSTPPMGRPGTAEEVADTIAFLASDRASYLTGTTVDVSGGR